MKKVVLLLLLLLAILFFWFLNTNQVSEQQTTLPINQVTLKAESDNDKKKTVEQIKQTLKQVTSGQVTNDLSVKTEEQKNSDWSYLSTYRRLEWAEVCQKYYRFEGRNAGGTRVRFVEDLTRGYQRNKNNPPLSEEVIKALDQYQNKCHALKETVFSYLGKEKDSNKLNTGNSVAVELEELLRLIPAKTEKEKRLHEHRELVTLFNESIIHLDSLERENDQLNATEEEAKYQEMMALHKQVAELGDSLDMGQALETYEQIQQQIGALQTELSNRFKVDGEDYTEAKEQMLNHWIELQSRLVTADPDVFFLMKKASESSYNLSHLGINGYAKEFHRYLLPFDTPGEQMMASMGVGGRMMFSMAANPATLLYLCGLGHDCSADSPLASYICLAYWHEMPEACTLMVDGFLIDQAISPNLLEDVLAMYQWMEQAYGT